MGIVGIVYWAYIYTLFKTLKPIKTLKFYHINGPPTGSIGKGPIRAIK